MNKTYRIVWNETTNTWVAVAEIAKAHGKSASVGGGIVASCTQVGARFAFTAAASAVLMMGAPAMAATVTDGTGINAIVIQGASSTATAVGQDSLAAGTNAAADGKSALAIGTNSIATGENATAYGNMTKATANNATAFGSLSQATAQSATAVGDGAEATAGQTTAVGVGTTASAAGATAVGHKSQATADHATALGSIANASTARTVAVGYNVTASQTDAVAVGSNAIANQANAVAVGVNAKAQNNSNIAIGNLANATGATSAISIGRESVASNTSTVAMGYKAQASGTSAIAVGSGSLASGISAIAIGNGSDAAGERTTVIGSKNGNVAATYSAIVGTSNAITSTTDVQVYGNTNTISRSNTYVLGSNNTVSGATESAVIAGRQNTMSGTNGVAVGRLNTVAGSSAVAIGQSSQALGTDGIALGNKAYANTGQNAIALGGLTYADQFGTALGARTSVKGDQGLAAATGAVVEGARAVAVGSYSFAGTEDAVALGHNTAATGSRAVAIGAGSVVSGVRSGAWGVASGGGQPQDNTTDRSFVGGTDSYAIGNKNIIGDTSSDSFVLGNNVKLGATGASIAITNVANRNGATNASTRTNTVNYTGATAITGAVALGSNTSVTVNDGVALGKGSVASTAAGQVGADPLSAVTNKTGAAWTSTLGAVSVGDIANNKTRQITSVAAGTEDTDAVNVAQLKAAITHYYSVNDNGTQGGNYDNDGAAGKNALAAGVDTSAETIESVAIGYKAVVKDDGSAPTNQEGSVAIGSSVTVSGKASIGIGRNVKAEARNAVAIGDTAIANKDQAVAIARDAQATGVGAVAMGSASRSSGSHTTALGVLANASVSRSVALGSEAVADRAGFANPTTTSVTASSASTFANKQVYAIDSATQGAKNAVIATVKNTTTNTYGAVSVGNGNVTRQIINVAAGSEDSDAVNVAQLKAVASAVAAGQTHYFSVKSDLSGADTNHANDGATGQNAIAVGLRSSSTATDSLAVGVDTKAAGNQSTAMGTSAKAEKVGATAVGNGAIASGESAVALGRSVTASGEEAFAAGRSSTASGARSTVIGKSASAAAGDSIVMGTNAKVEKTTSTSAVVIGNGAKATSSTTSTTDEGKDTVAIGFEAQTGASSNIAIGSKSKATGNAQATAIGYNTDAVGYQSIALGSGAKTTENGGSSVALGRDAQASHGNAVALGSASTTTLAVGTTDATVNNITYGGFAGTTPNSTVSVGNDTVKRTITNVAAGRINANSTDAINGSQLYATQQVLGNVANTTVDVLGGDAELTQSGVDAGKITMSDIGGTGKNTVHDAIAHVAQGFKVNTSASNGGSVSGNAEAVVKAGETVVVDAGKNIAITQDGKKISVATKDDVEFTSVTAGTGTNTVLLNNQGVNVGGNTYISNDGLNANDNKITNVANGAVAKDSKDAVNGDQLFTAAAAAKTEVTGSGLANVTKTTGGNNQDIYNVEVATAAAPTVARGNVTVADADKGKVMTAGDVANAITDSERTSSVVASSTAVTVAAGAEDANGNTEYTVDLSQGSKDSLAKADSALQDVVSTDPNLTAAKNGDTVSLSFSDTPTFTSVTADTFTAGDTTINTNGLTIAGGPSVTKTGLDNGGNKITNVAAGTNPTDAVNVSQLTTQTAAAKTEVTASGLATVTKTVGANDQDIYNVEVATAAAPTVARGNVTVADADKGKVMTAGDVANAINASEKTSSVVAATGAAVTVAAGAEDTNGNTEYTVDLSQGSKDSLAKADSALQDVVSTDPNLTATKNGDTVSLSFSDTPTFTSVTADTFTAGDTTITTNGLTIAGGPSITTAGINAGNKVISGVAPGVAGTDAVNVNQLNNQTAAAKTEVTGSGLANVTKTTGGNNQDIYNVEVATAAAPTVARGNVTVADADKGKVMTAGDVANAITDSERTSSVVASSTAVTVAAGAEDANGNTEYTVDLSQGSKDSLAKADSALQDVVSTDPNLTAAKNGDTVSLSFSDTPTFTSVTADTFTAGDTTINTNGLTIAGGPSVTKTGLDNGGNKITNVAAGTNPTDAVNVSQLTTQTAAAKTEVTASGLATVTKTVGANDQDIYNVEVATAAAPTVARGNVTVADADKGKVMTAGDVANAINASEKTSSVVAATGAAVTVAAGAEDTNGNTEYTVDLSQGSKDSLAKADSALQDVVSTDPNLTATKNGDTVSLSFSDTPTFTSVTADTFTAGDTTITTNGLTIAGGPSITTAGINAGNKVISGVAPGVAGTDAVNVNQLNNQTAAAKTEVTGSGLANVTKTTGGNNQDIYNVEVATAAAPTVARGNVTVADADKGKVMTAGDVANAINASEKTSSVVAATGAAVTVAAGAEDTNGNTEYTVDLSQGSKDSLAKADSALQDVVSTDPNLTAAKNGDTVSLSFSDTPTFTSVTADTFTAGDTTINTNGLTIAGGPSVTKTGLDNGGNKITNVANGDITSTSKDAINGSQLRNTADDIASIIGGNAAVDNAGNVTASNIGGTTATTIDDAIKTVKTTVKSTDNTIKVTANTADATKGTVFDISVDAQKMAESAQLPVVYTDANGNKVYKVNGKFTKDPTGQDANQEVAAANVIASMQNADGTISPTTLANIKAGTNDTDAVNVGQLKGAVDALGGGATINADGTIKAPTYNITNPANGTVTTANNVGDALKGLNDAVNSPLTFKGDSGEFNRNLGQTTTVKGGITDTTKLSDNNIGVVAKDGTLDIKLAKDIAVDSVTTGGTKLSDAGLSFVDASGSPVANSPSISKTGINAGNQVIAGVKAGTQDTDAVNVAQLNDKTATTPLTVGNTGAVDTPATADVNKLATAGDIANAINKAGFTLTTAKTTDGELGANSTSNELINAGDTVTVEADKNIKVTQTNGKISIATKDAVSFNSVTAGTGTNQVVLGDDGVKVGGKTYISDAGLNANDKKITNVANGDITSTSKDAINGSQLRNTADDIASIIGGDATVDDAGNVTASNIGGTTATTIDDAIKTVKTTVKSTDNTIKVTANTADATKGTVFDISVDAQKMAESAQLPVVYTDANGNKVYKVNGKFTKDPTGQDANQEVAAANVIASMQNADGTISPTTLANIKAGTNDTDAVNVGQLKGAVDALGGGATINADGTIKAPTYNITNPANGTVTTANNVGDALKGLNDAVNSPLTFKGDSGEFNRNLGQTTTVKGGITDTAKLSDNNIGVVAKDGALDIKLAKDIAVDSVKAGDTTVNTYGVSIANADPNKVVSLTAGGLNNGNNRITNVAAGQAGTDAVNKDQLDAAKTAATTKVVEGKNVKVTEQNNTDGSKTYTVATADEVEFNKATVGGVVVDGTSNKVSGLANGDVSATSTDAINGSQLFATNQNVANNATEIAKGINVGGTTGSNNYALGDTINVKGDSNISSETVEGGVQLKLNDVISVGTAKPVKIDGTKGTVGGLTNTAWDANNIVSGQAATEDQLKSAVSAAQAAATTKVVEGKNVKVTGQPNNDGSTTYTVATADEVAFDKVSVGNVTIDSTTNKISGLANGNVSATSTDAINGSQLYGTANSVATALGGGATVQADGTVSAPTYNITNPANGTVTTANNVGDALKGLNDAVNSPLIFAGDSGKNVERKLGTTLGIKGGVTDTAKLSQNNIGVVSNGTDTLEIQLAKELTGLTSVSTGNTVMNNDGVTITGAGGAKPVSLTNAGLDNGGNKITNVAAGTDATDAVNKDQLDKAQAAASNKIKAGDNIEVAESKNADGSTTYTVATAKDVNFNSVTAGTGANQVVLGDDGVKVGGNTYISNAGLNANDKKITNVAAGTVAKDSKDAINGSQLFAQGEGVKNIIGGNTVYDPATGTYTNNNIGGTGKGNINDAIQTVNTKADANATEIAKGLNFGANDQTATSGDAIKRQLGETIGIKGGITDTSTATSGENVITRTDTNGNINIELAKNAKFDSVTTGNTLVDNSGITIKAPTGGTTSDVKLTAGGLDNGGNKITNVAAGEKATDAVNKSQLDAAQAAASNKVKAGDNIEVAESKNADGSTTYTVATAKDVNFNSVTAGSGANQVVLDNDGVKVDGNTYISDAGLNANDKKITNVANGNVSATSTDAINGSQLYGTANSMATALGGGATVQADGTVSAPTYNITNPADGTVITANNVGDALKGLNDAVNSPLIFAGDSGKNVERKLGTTLGIKGGVTDAAKLSQNNIGVVSNGTDSLEIQLAKELAGLTSVSTGNTVMNNDGVTITGTGGAKPVSLTNAGLDNGGNKITNVAAGEKATDAVNKGQLDAAQAAASNKVKAGDNIEVAESKNVDGSTTYTVATAKDVNFNSVTAGSGANQVVLDNDGVKVGGNTYISNAGLNANNKKVSNVANGDVSATSKDAINGSQLFAQGEGVKNIIGGNTTYDPATGTYTNNNIGGTGKGNINDAIQAINTAATQAKSTVTAGNNIVVTPSQNADGSTNYTVATAKDLTVDSIKAGDTTINNAGVTVGDKVALTNTGLTAGDVKVSTDGINAGNKVITNVASGLNGKTLDQIKADPNAAERTNAASIGDLAEVQSNVTNITNNVTNITNNVLNGNTKDANGNTVTYVDDSGNLTDAGKVALTTYNVSGQTEFVHNSVISAIQQMNNEGIKYFHTNDGQTPVAENTNSQDSSASGKYASAVGYQTSSSGENATAVGSSLTVTTDSQTAGATITEVTENGQIVLKQRTTASGARAVALGAGSQALGADSIAIGTGNVVSGKGSGAIGDPNVVTGSGSYALGNNNTISTNNTFVVGNSVTQTLDNSVVLGNQSSATAIHTTANGGNYTFAGANDANVAGVNDVVGVVSVGTEGQTRQIQNVAAGVVSPTSTDAINGSQLYDTHQAIGNVANYTVNMGNQLNQRIDGVEKRSNAGTAAAMAVAGLPQAYLPGKSMMAVSGSTYRGESGYAVGFSSISDNGNWIIKGSATGNSRGHYGATAGVGYQW